MVRRIILFCTLAAFGLGPAIVVALGGRQRPLDPWIVVTAEARARASVLDVRAASWLGQCQTLADELAGMLRQLGDGSIGHAAEGTLVLHLQRRLRTARDLGEYAIYDRVGRLLLSTDGTRVTGKRADDAPELAQAARRPALILGRRGQEPVHLAIAAPVGRPLRGILVARLTTKTTTRLLHSAAGLTIRLVDGNGLALGSVAGLAVAATERLARLGTESRPGRLLLAGDPSAYFPLARARAAVVVSGSPAPLASPWRRWHLLVLGVVLALAAVGAWLLTRP